jgi:hypothetical protein
VAEASHDEDIMVKSLSTLGKFYEKTGHYATAAPLFESALSLLQKAAVQDEEKLASIRNNLAELYRYITYLMTKK